MTKPFSQACENNRQPILAVLQYAFAQSRRVLEIGSGTGQHAVYFAKHLPYLQWHTSDQVQYHAGINQWLEDEPASNLHPPITYQVGQDAFPISTVDAVFTANTAHIMQPQEVAMMMCQVAQALPQRGVFCQYGPFIQQGQFSSQSNHDFHHKLIAQGYGGYQDIATLQQWAPHLRLRNVHTMPANNLLLEWVKSSSS